MSRVAQLKRAASLVTCAKDSWRDVWFDLLALGQRWSRLPNITRAAQTAPLMGNLCCCAASVAPTGIFTAGDLDDISHQLELFFERVVPRTPRGTLDVKRCEREAIRDAVDQANTNVAKRYDEAFDAYALRDGAALPVAEKFRRTCATLTKEFSPDKPPRCELPPDSDVDSLIKMASENGAKLHEVLRQPVLKGGGACHPGPQKKAQRIGEKARSDYGGDVARVVDVERATGVFDSLDALNSTL